MSTSTVTLRARELMVKTDGKVVNHIVNSLWHSVVLTSVSGKAQCTTGNSTQLKQLLFPVELSWVELSWVEIVFPLCSDVNSLAQHDWHIDRTNEVEVAKCQRMATSKSTCISNKTNYWVFGLLTASHWLAYSVARTLSRLSVWCWSLKVIENSTIW